MSSYAPKIGCTTAFLDSILQVMHPAALPKDEDERIQALRDLRLLDTPSEERFDAITRLAARVLDVPIAFISLLDRDRQWFKARVGLQFCETSRSVSFCSHAILQDDPMVIEDARADLRFAEHPLVTGAPFLRFYAGIPLRTPSGHKVGTLCIADHHARAFPEDRREVLKELGGLAQRELALTNAIDAQAQLLETQQLLLDTRQRLEEELAAAGHYVRSLLPSPWTAPLPIEWRFLPSADLGGDGLGYHFLPDGRLAIFVLDVCGHGVASALLSVALLSTLRTQALAMADFTDPASVLGALNREFPMGRHQNRFFTIWYGVLHPGTGALTYSSGGHPPGILVHADHSSRRLAMDGIPIGCQPGAAYTNAKETLRQSDALWLFSDGAFEVRSRGASSLDHFEALLRDAEHAHSSPLEAVTNALRERQGRLPFSDDVTLLRVQMR